MANQFYTPIIKGKLNDLKALGKLSSSARDKIKPMIEAMPLKKGEDLEKHLNKLAHYLIKHVPLGDIYLDFYGLRPDLTLPDGTNATISGFKLVKALGRTVTPVYGFDRNDSLWPLFKEVVAINGRGFCFRIDVDDLDDQAEESWAQVLERSAEIGLNPSEIDLMLDLRDFKDLELDELQEIVLDFFTINPRIYQYRKIIIAGSSALKTVAEIPKDDVGEEVRRELTLWSRIQREVPDSAAIVFGDYGVIHPDFSDQGSSKYMNAKIRYTVRGRILYFRGHGLLHPAKDYAQYHSLAAKVRDSGCYLGRGFSYGDWYINDVADFNCAPGSPATWVMADMNHHLEYTTAQMSRLVQKVREVSDVSELEEIT